MPVAHPFFQVGVLVRDIEAARAELSNALGVTWGEVVHRVNGDWQMAICFSLEGPPYIALIHAPDGSPWDASAGSRIDHIGFWAPDIERSAAALEDAGMELEIDGRRMGAVFTYHRGPDSGLRVEMIDRSGRAGFYERFGLPNPEPGS
jgi:hypothetical protein